MRPLGKPTHRWEDNIKTDLREVVYEGMDWVDLAQDRVRWRAVVNAVVKFSLGPVSFLGKTLLHEVS
jgi:hypothetical protein